jgi:phenylalanyl-tRNA synthetase beta chain
MKISIDWLKNYIDVDMPVSRLVEVLDNIGLLIEELNEKDGDVILEVETYANRPDTLGHLGIARELAAALGLAFKDQTLSLTEIDEDISDLIDVQIRDEELCPRYCGMIVKDVTVGPSPDWLVRKITAMGLSPINNIVDVTNYVLFSTAQPIHAFDLDKVEGKKIIIRRAKQGEKLLSLESKEVELTPDMLVIADEQKPMALAGVIGGEETAVSASTKNVFIESAHFDPVSIRKTSKATGIQTDAAYRFERGTDVSFPPEAARMVASLLTQFGGKVCKNIVDVYPKPRKAKTVMLRDHRVTSILGVAIDNGFIEKTLKDLGFRTEQKQKGIWRVGIPHFRIDIEREADLIEEIARFYGYDKIPAELPPLRSFEPIYDGDRGKVSKLRQIMFHYGFDEVVNFSFMDPGKEVIFASGLSPIPIRNPISTKAANLRTTLLGGLLENTAWNINRGAEGVHIFEVGNVFFLDSETHKEQLLLNMTMTGIVGERNWKDKGKESSFFYLKGTCEALMSQLGYGTVAFRKQVHPHFQDGHSLALFFKGEKIGALGVIKQAICDAYALKGTVLAAEINLSLLFGKQPRAFQFSTVAKYPSVNRDVSFIGNEKVLFEEIREVLGKLRLPYLEKFDLYDRFSGKPIPDGHVSLSLRFTFRHPERTLQAGEVDSLQEKIIATLKARFGFQLREGGKIDK